MHRCSDHVVRTRVRAALLNGGIGKSEERVPPTGSSMPYGVTCPRAPMAQEKISRASSSAPPPTFPIPMHTFKTMCAVRSSAIALFATLCFPIAFAQQGDGASDAPDHSAVSPVALKPEFGQLEGGSGWTSVGADCRKTGDRKLASGMVVVVGYESCSIGSSYTQNFVRIFAGGDQVLVERQAVFIPPEAAQRLAQRTPQQIADSTELWKRYGMELRVRQLEKALKALRATSALGIALLDSSVYDVSEHTEGTGFRVEVLNTTKKTIKYVTFEVTGLNAVNDPVRDRLRQTSTMRLRGIGPIEPDGSASYEEDYMWHTDVVEYHRINSVRVEYMDGTTKSIRDVAKVRLSKEDVEVLESE